MSILTSEYDTYIHTHFETIDDLLNIEIPKANRSAMLHNHNETKRSWWGIDGGYKGVINAISRGWPEGLHRAQEQLQLMQLPRVRSSRRRRVQSDFGDSFDIQKMYAGKLDQAWQTTERVRSTNVGQHNATIIVELALSASVAAESAFWRGATAVMLADMLQTAGRNVKIIGMNTVSGLYSGGIGTGKLNCTSVVLKDYTQPLDLDLLIATTSAGMNRSLMFDSKYLHTKFGRIKGSLGVPRTGFLPEYLDDGSNVIRVEDIWSRTAAERKLKLVAEDYNAYT